MAEEDRAVTKFREYLKIKSVHPNPDYDSCVRWIKVQATELNLKLQVVHFPAPGEFVVILTWKGKNSSLKSIMLNSHMDVVPVNELQWTHEPFGAEKDSTGNIYARGAQDTKCIGVQYLEAIRKLKEKAFVPLRDIHVVFVPDEELGGKKGMALFVKTEEFTNLNIGFALDEGLASVHDGFVLSYAERAICQVKYTAKGTTGHSLLIHENTAAEKIQIIIKRLLEFRELEKNRLQSNPQLGLGDVTSVNMTMMQGGVQMNVVPAEMSVSFDLRITPSWETSEVKKFLDDIAEEAGSDVSYEFILHTLDYRTETDIKNNGNIWWNSFKETCDDLGLELNPMISPGSTDMRYVRQEKIPCLGFSPINNHPVLLHANDEFLNENTFLTGIDIYESIIWNLANINK